MTHEPPALTFLFELRVNVAGPIVIGSTPMGERRIVPILGGTFEGPDLRGRVLPGGADWQIIRADGVAELDARYVIETNRGQTIYVRNTGLRHAPPEIMRRLLDGQAVDPGLVYFRTAPAFETSAPDLLWLTRATFVGSAERHPEEVIVRVWKVE